MIEHLNFAKNGDPNGAVLDSGHFVHMKPRAAQAIGLHAGLTLKVEGKLKMSRSGGQKVIEAESVNGIDVTSARAANKTAPTKNAAKRASKKSVPAKKTSTKQAAAKKTRVARSGA